MAESDTSDGDLELRVENWFQDSPINSQRCVQVETGGVHYLVLEYLNTKNHGAILEEFLKKHGIKFKINFNTLWPFKDGEKYRLVGAGTISFADGVATISGKSVGYSIGILQEPLKRLPEVIEEVKRVEFI